MCGRFALTKNIKDVKSRFRLSFDPEDSIFRFNIAPGQTIGVVLNESPHVISTVQWGLIPHWAKDKKTGYKMINARGETISEKPSFKHPFRKKRCLVLADAFYEWKRADEKKVPYRVLMKDESAFAMAGIWDEWQGLKTCSIITTAANGLLSSVHDRMPVILKKEEEEEWLEQSTESSLLKMIKPYNEDLMKMYAISSLVNSPQNNDERIIVPREEI